MRRYPTLATELGLHFCGGVRRDGYYCPLDHRRHGTAEPGGIHMADVRPTKAGTARFLKLAATALDPTLDQDVPWRRVYRRHLAARELARRLGIPMPGREHWDFDRAFVRASTAGLTNDEPLRREAHLWARR